MNEDVLKKRIHKLVIVSIGIVCVILGMAYCFVSSAEKSLSKATYSMMDRQLYVCKSHIQSQVDNEMNSLEMLVEHIEGKSDSADVLIKEFMENKDFSSAQYFSLDQLKNDSKHIHKGVLKAMNGIKNVTLQKENREFNFYYSLPVYQETEVVGVLNAKMNASYFSEVIKSIFDSGNVYVTDFHSYYSLYGDDGLVKQLKALDLKQTKQSCIRLNQSKKFLVSMDLDDQDYSLCYVNSSKNMNGPLYKMYQTYNILFLIFGITVIVLLTIAYLMMLSNNKELVQMAYTDQLTSAISFSRFTQLVQTYAKKNPQYSLVALNVRRFKFMNEILGRDKADAFLCKVVDTIKLYLGTEEMICRDSADVFYLLLWDVDETILTKRMHDMLQGIYKNMDSFHYDFEFCCGICNNGAQKEYYTVEQMLTNVMFALSQSKESTQQSICFFNEQVHAKKEFENYIESNMQQALEHKDFEMLLQPKVDVQTKEVVAAEALVRWRFKDGTYLQPATFVPIFEKNRFCAKLDFYMLEKAICQIRNWMNQGVKPFEISVNQSRIVFYDENYVQRVKELLEKYDVSGSYITLEVLENTVIENIDLFNKTIRELKKLGVHISLDDFGSGYSSLNVLSKLDIDELKIDRIFLNSNSKKESDKTRWILEAIIHFARKLDIKVVVEGVENQLDHSFIQALGANIGQGYYYSRPISVDIFDTNCRC